MFVIAAISFFIAVTSGFRICSCVELRHVIHSPIMIVSGFIYICCSIGSILPQHEAVLFPTKINWKLVFIWCGWYVNSFISAEEPRLSLLVIWQFCSLLKWTESTFPSGGGDIFCLIFSMLSVKRVS